MAFDKKTYNREYNRKFKDKTKLYNKEYYTNHKDESKEYSKKYRSENLDRERKRVTEYHKKRKIEDPVFKLRCHLTSVISNSLIKRKYTKKSNTYKILGCSWNEFKQYIESQFEPWMNWDNYGGQVINTPNTTWDIDHIIPLSYATSEEEIIKLNHYTNLRPLCSYYNRFIKRDNI